MSARIYDFSTFFGARRYNGLPVVESARRAEAAYQDRLKREARARDRSAAGKLGAAAAKGKPRHCGWCRERGHNAGNCPRFTRDARTGELVALQGSEVRR
jgi:hypothetical protein